MNELVGIFNNSIKCTSSLKECIDFAFLDDEIGMGEKGKLVALINNTGAKKSSISEVYREMLPKRKKVEEADYLYLIAAYSWSDTEPEAEFEFALLDTMKIYAGHKALVSVHVCDEAIYAHILVKREDGAEWNVPENLPEFCAINQDVPFAVREYCEAMRYLMY